MTTSPEFEEIGEKVELSNGFYCTFNGKERTFFNNSNEWNIYVEDNFFINEDIESMFPFKLEFCDIIFIEGDDFQVTTIGSSAFSQNETISKVVLPETITTINVSAFANCSNLSEINLEHVTNIGISAFSDTALTNVEINENVTSLNSVFYGCSDLTYVLINSSLVNPGDVISLTVFNDEIKIYVPDQYYINNYSIFASYLNNIFPINGTYPETPSQEPDHEVPSTKTLTVNYYVEDDLYDTKSFECGYYDSYVSNIPLPDDFPFENGQLFRGWGENIDDMSTLVPGLDGTISLSFDTNETVKNLYAKFYTIPYVEGLEQNTTSSTFTIKSDAQTFETPEAILSLSRVYETFEFETYEDFRNNLDKFKTFFDTGKYTVSLSGATAGNYPAIWYFIYNYEDLEKLAEDEKYNNGSINAPISIKIINFEFYDFTEFINTPAHNSIINLLSDKKEITGTSIYISYSFNIAEASSLETFILNSDNTSYIYLRLTGLNNATNLKEIVINHTDSVVNNYSGGISNNFNSNIKIYVPDELYDDYLINEGWSPFADQIYKLSERTSL